VDIRLQRVSNAVAHFFEDELSQGLHGLSQAARDHLDRFRSFLHAFYIEQHGFWPPNRFEQEVVQRLICSSMHGDFLSLYHHLADPSSSSDGLDAGITAAGGVCIAQNIRAFNARQRLPPLPHTLPTLPKATDFAATKVGRRNSWNPRARHREEKSRRNTARMQSLIDSTNRDWTLMNCVLVRRYSEFEVETAVDELQDLSLAEARKVRWLVVYSILQILSLTTTAPKQVRNTEGLSYPLCCEAPVVMPWEIGQRKRTRPPGPEKRISMIEPDTLHSHTNTAPPSPVSLSRTLSSTTSLMSKNGSVKHATSVRVDDRRQTIAGDIPGRTLSRRPPSARPSSLRRLMSIKKAEVDDEIPAVPMRPKIPSKRASFCEIYVPGYGNGLNDVDVEVKVDKSLTALPAVNSTVSRESSNASNTTSRSKSSAETEIATPDSSPLPGNDSVVKFDLMEGEPKTVVDGDTLLHFNTSTWDDMLNVLEKRRFNIRL
jgi:hypothetical protein